ncbi:MAG: site-2 protease family protein [Acetobacteraceae bacterium]|nr:site-2 protease family protein [Acetobacteraceae bacterium]
MPAARRCGFDLRHPDRAALMPWWIELVPLALAAVLAITLHEAAHGYAARALGDDTAARLGRISLNPLRHVDPVGTLVVPLAMAVVQLLAAGQVMGVFGWAKPVPVNLLRLSNPRRDMMLVAAAGPAANALLAVAAGLAGHAVLLLEGGMPPELAGLAFRFLGMMILVNLVLGLFNLIPIPPLDGGRILVGLLPPRAAMLLARLERFGLAVVIGVVFLLPLAVPGFDPFGVFLREVVAPAIRLVLFVTGHGA